MMKTLQLTRFAKARMWFGERVTRGFDASGVITGAAGDAPVVGPNSDMLVGLEVLVPRGAYSEYGLLGLEFLPGNLGCLRIEVPYSDMAGSPWSDALASNVDEVRLGLPQEYASSVLASLASTAAGRIPSGTLRIVDAAHGIVGSSPSFFGKLSGATIELMSLSEIEVPEEFLVTLLRRIVVE
jgi:hypothetical protein